MDAVLLGHVWDDQLEEHCHCQHVIYWKRYLNYVFSALRTNQIARVQSMWPEPKNKNPASSDSSSITNWIRLLGNSRSSLSFSLPPAPFYPRKKKMGTSKHNVCNIRGGLMCSQRSYILLNMDRKSISHICVEFTQTRLTHASTPTWCSIATASAAAAATAAAAVMDFMRRRHRYSDKNENRFWYTFEYIRFD